MQTKTVLKHLAFLLPLLAAAFYLRFSGLEDWMFTGDDTWHLKIADYPLQDVPRQTLKRATHPPLYFILQHFFTEGFHNPLVYRSLPILLGLILILNCYMMGWLSLRSACAAIFMAWITAFQPIYIVQSQVIRQYGLQLALVAGMIIFSRAWMEHYTRKAFWGYALCALGALETHFISYMAVFGCGMSGLIFAKNWDERKKWFLLHISLATVLVWHFRMVMQVSPNFMTSFFKAPSEVEGFAVRTARALQMGFMVRGEPSQILLLPLALGVPLLWKLDRRLFTMCAFAVGLCVLSDFGGYVKIAASRRTLVAHMFLLVVAASSFAYVERRFGLRKAAIALAVFLAIHSGFSYDMNNYNPNRLRTLYAGDFKISHDELNDALLFVNRGFNEKTDLLLISRTVGGNYQRRFDLPSAQLPLRVMVCNEYMLILRNVRGCLDKLYGVFLDNDTVAPGRNKAVNLLLKNDAHESFNLPPPRRAWILLDLGANKEWRKLLPEKKPEKKRRLLLGRKYVVVLVDLDNLPPAMR